MASNSIPVYYSDRVTYSFLIMLKKVMFASVFGFVLIVFQPNKTFSQVKMRTKPIVTDSKTLKTIANLNHFISNKYNDLDTSFFWVMNAECQPIENAIIILSNRTGVSDTITKHNYEGLYFLTAPSPGIYKLVVEAPGYETQIQHMEVFYPAKFKKRIALGKSGDLYLPTVFGFFPLTSPVEYVSFAFTKPSKYDKEPELFNVEIRKELNKLKKFVNASDTFNLYFNRCLAWPTGSAKRSEFRKVIEESQILKTYSLTVIGDCSKQAGALVKTTGFFIDETADESTIRSVFQKNNFAIYKISQSRIEGWSYWDIGASYEAPLSRDLLIDIQNINLALPMVRVSIDYIAGVESTNR